MSQRVLLLDRQMVFDSNKLSSFLLCEFQEQLSSFWLRKLKWKTSRWKRRMKTLKDTRVVQVLVKNQQSIDWTIRIEVSGMFCLQQHQSVRIIRRSPTLMMLIN